MGALLAFAGTGLAAEPTAAPAPLEPVVVAAPKLHEETLIDRKVYETATDVQSTFGSVSDVLNVIPSVTVDADGLVSLRGDTNVLILIDGKPSAQFAGSAAGENLLSLSAQDIERIEVMTTPPAQFKADGAAGVINIITRKKRQPGLVGQVQGSLGPSGREVLGAGGSWQSGPVSASASLGFRQELRARQLRSDLRTSGSPSAPSSDSQATTNETIHRSTPSIGLKGEATLDERTSVSAALSWTRRGGLRTYTERTGITSAGTGLTSSGERISTGHDPETDVDMRLGYTRQLDQPGATLDLSLHRSSSHQHEHYDYADETFIPQGVTALSNLDFLETHAITDLGADYGVTLSEGGKLKLGYAFQLDNYGLANSAFVFPLPPAAPILNSDLTNDFQYRQRIHAAYTSYQATSGAWTWLGGLRVEQTLTEASQLSSQNDQSGSYLKVYPSVHVDHALSDSDTLSFGFSERITRPDPGLLNPYVDHEYTPNLQAGNPALKPQYTQSFELGYDHDSQGRHYGLTGYVRRNRDSVTDVTEYLGNGLSLTTKTNLPRSDAAGVEFIASGHLGPKFGYGVSGNLFTSQIDASGLGQLGLQSTTGLNGKLKLEYQPVAGDTAQLTMTRTDRRLTPQGYVGAVNLVNLGYRHQIRKDLTAVATVSDLFNGQRTNRIVTTPNFVADYSRAVQGRILYVGLVHRFGASKKGEPGKFDYEE